MSLPAMHRLFQDYRYAIVDASSREELPKTWRQQVIAPSFLGSDTARCPVLVDIASLSTEDRGMLLDRLEIELQEHMNPFFSLLLASDADLAMVSSHLARRLVVQGERHERLMQFRYFDPGTFLQLPSLLGEAGMHWLLGPVSAVMVPCAGECQRYERPMAASKGFSLATRLPALLDISIINRAAMQLPPAANQQCWIERCSRIGSHLGRAREYPHMFDRDDLVAFTLHAENCHPRFDDHEIIRALLEELARADAQDQLDYRELTARLAPEAWERIARDLSEDKSREGMPS